MNTCDADAPANRVALKISVSPSHRRAFSSKERAALKGLSARFSKGYRSWPAQYKEELAALLQPAYEVLDHVGAARSPRNSVVHILVVEMHSRNASYLRWPSEDWLEVLTPSEREFHKKHGASGNCRQYAIALAYLLCEFDRLFEIGRFFQYRLALKVFGRKAVDEAAAAVDSEMSKLGFIAGRPHLSVALFTAMLLQRSPRIEDLTFETLQRVALAGPTYVRQGAATLSRTLARMGILVRGFDHRIDDRNRPALEYRAVAGVPEEWLRWCDRWRGTTVKAESTIVSGYYGLLKCGRWLAATHPEIASPSDWGRSTAIEYVAAVARMTIGQWSAPRARDRDRRGCPLKPAAKASLLRAVRSFFRDLQDWEWIPRKFDPVRAMGLPRAIGSLIGPDPRVVADDAWAKIVWAGLNLREDDLASDPGAAGSNSRGLCYPIEMVRALVMLWLFAGLRRDELRRMRVGSIRWQTAGKAVDGSTCLLDVPVSKTATAFTKPIDAIVGHAWTGQLFVDTSVAIIEGNDRGIYEQQSAVHG